MCWVLTHKVSMYKSWSLHITGDSINYVIYPLISIVKLIANGWVKFNVHIAYVYLLQAYGYLTH